MGERTITDLGHLNVSLAFSSSVLVNTTDLTTMTGTEEETVGSTSSSSEEIVPISGLWAFALEYAKVHGYISICVCFFGILFNIANIVVLTRNHMRTSTNVILTGLAVADLFTMLDYFPFAIKFYVLREPDLEMTTTRSYGWMCYLLFHANFSIACHSTAIWFTISLATFRFLYIWFPTRGSVYCSIERAIYILVIIVGAVLITCIPNVMVNDYTEAVKDNISTGNNTYELDIFYHWKQREGPIYHVFDNINKMVQAILFKIIPCALLTVLTILLVTAMHRAYKKRMALKNQGRREESERHGEHNRTTRMLLAVVGLFLFTELPQGILTIMTLVDESLYNSVYLPLGDLLDIMALCNNAINFILYCTMSRQFRETFVKIFCSKFPNSRPGWMKLKLAKSQQNGETQMTMHTHV